MDDAGGNERAAVDSEQLLTLAESAGVDTVRAIVEAYWNSNAELLAALRAAHAAGDHDEGAKVAHALKGSSANLGAVLLQERAQRLEEAHKIGDQDAAASALVRFEADEDVTRDAFDQALAQATA